MKFKKLLCLFLTVCMILPASGVFAHAAKNGDIVNYVLYTDIVTYINGSPIASYNIDGYTAVVVEDLSAYGFNVTWNALKRTLSVTRGSTDTITSNYRPTANTHTIGSRAMAVLYTDIVTYLNGTKVKSYNVNGRTIIYVDDLAEFYSSSYVWSAGRRTLSMTLKPASGGTTTKPVTPPAPSVDYSWTAGYTERDASINYLYYGFAASLKNDGKGGFSRVSSSGSIKAVEGLTITASSIGFDIYQDITYTQGSTITDLYNNLNYNITNSSNNIPDTPAQRKKLSKYFSVIINGTEVYGTLTNTKGNGHYGFVFNFDGKYQYSDIKTLTITVGEVRDQNEYMGVADMMNASIDTSYVTVNGGAAGIIKKTNVFRLPSINTGSTAANTLNTIIYNDFKNYTFMGGMGCEAFKNYVSANSSGINTAYGSDSWYWRTVDYTTEKNGTSVTIRVTYTTYPLDGGAYSDTVSYTYDFSRDTYKTLGSTATNYINDLRTIGTLGLSSTDRRYSFLYYLMSGDMTSLEKLDGVSAGTYDVYKYQGSGNTATGLKFSSFSASYDKSTNTLRAVFNIAQSSIASIPQGIYVMTIPADVKMFTLLGSGQSTVPTYESESIKAVRMWLENSGDYNIYSTSALYAMTDAQKSAYGVMAYDFLIARYGSLSSSDLQSLARTVFGLDTLVPSGIPDRFTGLYSTKTHNGDIWSYDIISDTTVNGVSTVRVQFYSDFAKSNKSVLVDYNVTANAYGVAFGGSSVVSSGSGTPAHYSN